MNPYFVEAVELREHPIKHAQKKTRDNYIVALTYVIEKCLSEIGINTIGDSSIRERLNLYQNQLNVGAESLKLDNKKKENSLRYFLKPWRNKYRILLICDLALLLLDKSLISLAISTVKNIMSSKQRKDADRVITLLFSEDEIEKKYLPSERLIIQFRNNNRFYRQKERRIIVTANMSAGKSTLINALVGKHIARTSQEVCTGNVCYLYNKPFEDGEIHLSTETLNYSATSMDLREYDWDGVISIASYFAAISGSMPRQCIIDTPGVDAALYKEHSVFARNALLNGNYDKIIYVVSPTRLGTEAEMRHLKWVSENLPKDKIVFVLNKLDEYHDYCDSVEESVCGFKNDLLQLGFEEPIICPISAYFSYLLKLKITGQPLSEDELDEYALYSKKFMRASYDLSVYYDSVQCESTDTPEITLSKRAGLYGLEKTIYGG